MKIWSRTIKKEKLRTQTVLEFDERQVTFYDIVKSVCENLDIPTPVILTKHLYDLKKFGITIFKSDDFVENVNFDKLTLEIVKEK